MAAGTIVLAHDSGGPKLDIVIPYNDNPTGFLARDAESYADAMDTILNMSEDMKMSVRENARESVSRFSEEEFEGQFLAVLDPLML